MSDSPPYTPAAHLIASSHLTDLELLSHFQDFCNNLRYVSTAPELVFERLVANLSNSIGATFRMEWQDLSRALQASQLANENLIGQLEANSSTLQIYKQANEKLIAELAKIKQNILKRSLTTANPTEAPAPAPAPPGPSTIVTANSVVNPLSGSFHTSELRSPSEAHQRTSKLVSFNNAFHMVPGVVVGISAVDVARNAHIRVNAYANQIQQDSFRINLDTWQETTLHGAGCNWLAIEATDRDFQYGSYHTREDHEWTDPQMHNTRKIIFKRQYPDPPTVVVWLNVIDLSVKVDWRIKAFASDITRSGFTIHVDTWSDSILYTAMASWVAYSSDRPGIASGSFSTLDIRSWVMPQVYNSGFQSFDAGMFKQSPRVFVALNSLHIDHRQNMRLQVKVDNVNAAGMTWHLDAWLDTALYSAGACYIALL